MTESIGIVFEREGFVVIPEAYDPTQSKGVLDETLKTKYFTRPRRVNNTNATVSKLTGRSLLQGTELGAIINTIASYGPNLNINLEEDRTVLPYPVTVDDEPVIDEEAIQVYTVHTRPSDIVTRDTRVETYELAPHSLIASQLGEYGIGAFAALEGRAFIYSESGRHSQLLEPGDLAFASGERYKLEPFANESSTVLLVAGERWAYELPELED